MTQHRRSGERGFTLTELVVVLPVLIFLVGFAVHLILSTQRSHDYTQRVVRSAKASLELINMLRYELASSVKLFQNNAVGLDYLALLELDAQAVPLDTSTLPTIDVDGIFQMEATSRSKTGNSLFFARQAWTTEFQCTSAKSYRIDVYRAVYYYLAKEDGGPKPGSNIGLNLCRFVGEPLADGGQIDRISDPTDQLEVLRHLHDQTPDADGERHDAVQLVWLRGEDPGSTGTIRQIEPVGYTLSDTPLSPRPSNWLWKRDLERSLSGLLHHRRFSIVSNFARGSWGVGKFGRADATGDGFPHGFEVQNIGPSAARKILLHLTLCTTNNAGHQAHSDMRSIVFAGDI